MNPTADFPRAHSGVTPPYNAIPAAAWKGCKERSMYLPKVLDPAAHAYRVQYAIANILRDRVANEGAFINCFEMEDRDEVICAILSRGLKNPVLRRALERSHVVNLTHWLVRHPEFSEAYHRIDSRSSVKRDHSRLIKGTGELGFKTRESSNE